MVGEAVEQPTELAAAKIASISIEFNFVIFIVAPVESVIDNTPVAQPYDNNKAIIRSYFWSGR